MLLASHANLSRTIPSTVYAGFAAANNLQFLDVSHNSLGGNLNLYTKLASLSFLEVSYNRYFGSIPAGFSTVTGLGELSAGNNLLSGGIPPALATMPQLSVLFLPNNSLTGKAHLLPVKSRCGCMLGCRVLGFGISVHRAQAAGCW